MKTDGEKSNIRTVTRIAGDMKLGIEMGRAKTKKVGMKLDIEVGKAKRRNEGMRLDNEVRRAKTRNMQR